MLSDQELSAEAHGRNYALLSTYGRLPSYTMWRSEDVPNDLERLMEWWETMLDRMKESASQMAWIAEMHVEKYEKYLQGPK